jgi:hypothetical protein
MQLVALLTKSVGLMLALVSARQIEIHTHAQNGTRRQRRRQ